MSRQTLLLLMASILTILVIAVVVKAIQPAPDRTTQHILEYGAEYTGDARPTLRILMIGNSHLRRGAIASKVAELANSDSDACPYHLITGFYGQDGAMLIDHWNRTRAKAALTEGEWDRLLLQDASWSTIFPAAKFDETTRNWIELARAHNVEPALITTWARDNSNPMYSAVPVFNADRNLMQGVVTRRHADTAATLGIGTVPVGPAWRLAWSNSDLPTLFHRDGNHTNTLSQWLTALTIYHYLCEQPDRMPASVLPEEVTPHAPIIWAAVLGARGQERKSVENPSEIDALALSATKALQ
ncbi:MAG: hypothetical protein KI792_00205 [Alphaproteobacteria bacterium]|nr:hypothetical protein [Alphaproteobacteria bacterium SS10]